MVVIYRAKSDIFEHDGEYFTGLDRAIASLNPRHDVPADEVKRKLRGQMRRSFYGTDYCIEKITVT